MPAYISHLHNVINRINHSRELNGGADEALARIKEKEADPVAFFEGQLDFNIDMALWNEFFEDPFPWLDQVSHLYENETANSQSSYVPAAQPLNNQEYINVDADSEGDQINGLAAPVSEHHDGLGDQQDTVRAEASPSGASRGLIADLEIPDSQPESPFMGQTLNDEWWSSPIPMSPISQQEYIAPAIAPHQPGSLRRRSNSASSIPETLINGTEPPATASQVSRIWAESLRLRHSSRVGFGVLDQDCSEATASFTTEESTQPPLYDPRCRNCGGKHWQHECIKERKICDEKEHCTMDCPTINDGENCGLCQKNDHAWFECGHECDECGSSRHWTVFCPN
ncbi:hypothetical protein F5882DRAFT_440335 [Hyaloscypha sp. PMI_1271]|nr:hypothetical protein F5882DRAFT_440335 [Hyaloscypha sp. PMI_1271]